MKKILKKLVGLDRVEEAKAEAELLLKETTEKLELAKQLAEEAKKEEELAKMTPKQRATARGEPWVSVLETHVNKENIRNGFFELDWNQYFIVELKKEGYGFDGDKDEEIVDRWFRDLARNILSEEGQDMNRGAGYINVNKLGDGKAEVR
jgi:flagellar biosynthesis GTPase FlhF